MNSEEKPLLKIVRHLSKGSTPLTVQFFGEPPNKKSSFESPFEISPSLESNDLELFIQGDKHSVEIKDIPPLFFEESHYRVVIEFPENFDIDEIDLIFPHERMKSKFHPAGSKSVVISGVIETKSRIGLLPVKINYRQQEILGFTIEIFPSKLDYRQDFRQMMEDIMNVAYQLAFDFDQISHLGARPTDEKLPTDEVWFNILDTLFKNMIRSFRVVSKNPKRNLEATHQMVRPAHVRRSSSHLRRWIRTNQSKLESVDKKLGLVEVDNRNLSARRLPEERRKNTFDTVENQFLKYVVRQTKKRLRRFKQKYEKYTGGPHTRKRHKKLIERLKQMQGSLSRLEHYDFIKEASQLRKRNFNSHVMQMSPGYKTIYKYYFLLQKGLELEGKPFELEPKDIYELYEYWCFIKIIELLSKNNFDVDAEDLIQISSEGLRFSLRRGKKSKVLFENEDNKFTLFYNWSDSNKGDFPGNRNDRTFEYNTLKELQDEPVNSNPTGKNKPDIMLEMKKKEADYPEIGFRFIFDAKYRNEEFKKGILGPRPDTINTMHRYRDAIISELDKDVSSKYIRKVINAIVLFPLGGQNQGEKIEKYYKSHPFFRSIGEVGIGGIPFLPGTTEKVEALIQDWLNYQPEQFRDKRILQLHPDEIEWYDERSKEVMVGVVPKSDQEERWKLITEDKIYHVPASKVNQRRLSVDYLAFYFPQNTSQQLDCTDTEKGHILYYSKIKNTKIIKREEIPLKSHTTKKDEPYVVYELEEIEKLDSPILNTYGDPAVFRFGTLYTLKRASILPELYITTPEQQSEWRKIKNSSKNYRPRIIKWETDGIGDKEAEIEFIEV